MNAIEQLGKAMQQFASEGKVCSSLNISPDEAIRISKILSQAPEERLTMILSVLEKARIYIDGLEELEEWKALKDQAYLIDISEFMEAIMEEFENNEVLNRINIPAKEFTNFCRKQNLKPILVKRALARRGYLVTTNDSDRVEYTQNVWTDGKGTRCVVLLKEPIKK